MYRIISLGWGVQSFTLAAMVALGELEPVDVAIHSDTGYESKLTYEFAKRWTPFLEERGVKVVTVKATSGSIDEIYINRSDNRKFLRIPAYYKKNGKKSSMMRQCTSNWKIKPIRQWLQANRNKQQVEQLIGISIDEIKRAKDSGVKYIVNRFPLIEKKMSRSDCVAWLEKNGIEIPPKSACVFCPYHSKQQWKNTKLVESDWKLALAVDESIRHYDDSITAYLSNKLIPLSDLDLDD